MRRLDYTMAFQGRHQHVESLLHEILGGNPSLRRQICKRKFRPQNLQLFRCLWEHVIQRKLVGIVTHGFVHAFRFNPANDRDSHKAAPIAITPHRLIGAEVPAELSFSKPNATITLSLATLSVVLDPLKAR